MRRLSTAAFHRLLQPPGPCSLLLSVSPLMAFQMPMLSRALLTLPALQGCPGSQWPQPLPFPHGCTTPNFRLISTYSTTCEDVPQAPQTQQTQSSFASSASDPISHSIWSATVCQVLGHSSDHELASTPGQWIATSLLASSQPGHLGRMPSLSGSPYPAPGAFSPFPEHSSPELHILSSFFPPTLPWLFRPLFMEDLSNGFSVLV